MGRIVGIDLGTTTSEIGYIKNGKPELIENRESVVPTITPSIVGLDNDMKPLVGDPAKNQMVFAKDRTVQEIKRKMGTDDVVLLAGKKFTPVEISTLILKKLKSVAEEYLNEEITSAVITVPANFNEAQRQATKEAGEKAGFIVERIINEPTAAALAFGIDNIETEGKILVYDLGGGTFDVTVLEMIENSLDVRSSRGINELGGKDFTQKIADEIVNRFKQEFDIDLSEDEKAYARVKEEAEKAKIALSAVTSIKIYLSFIAFKDGQPISYETELTREQYETLIADYINDSIKTVDEALKAAKITDNEIDIVLAVGGSSRTPLVLQKLRERFGNKIRGGINPDEAVSLGAAVQAGILSNEISGSGSIAIFDVCNHTLGTDIYNTEKNCFEYSRIIMRDTHIPFAKTRSYQTTSDYQTSVEVSVYQGECDDVFKNTKIGSFEVTGIPENYAGKEKIDIEFRYNENGMLDVNVTVVSTGKVTSQKFDMTPYDPQTGKSEVDISSMDGYEHSEDVKTTMQLYQNYRNSLPEDVKKQADKLIEELKQAVVENNIEKIEELDDKITSIIFDNISFS